MKALHLIDLGHIALMDVAVPDIADDELLVRMGASTICTSDLNDIRENAFGIVLPHSMGHEAAGTVAAVGSKVLGFRVGDRVATHPVHPCGICETCREGLAYLCPNMRHFGISLPGTFAEAYVVRQDRARHLPNGVTFEVGALAEPVSVCLQALAQARLTPGETLLIVGDGPFGVLMSRLAMPLGLERVVMAGWEDFRLSRAGSETLPVNTRDLADPVSALLDANGGQGYHAAILAVSSREAVTQGLGCLRRKGRFVIFSAIAGSTPVDLFSLHLHELELIGACSDNDRLDDAMRLLSEPALGLSDLVTHRFPITEYREAFRTAAEGHDRALKVAITLD